MRKDERIYELVASHSYRRSRASIFGIALGIVVILFAVGVWFVQGFNPVVMGIGVLFLWISLAMK